MITLNEAVIVEGKYDKIKLSSIIDAIIVTTDGYGVFKDKEKLSFIRRLAETRGIIILTDSDSAGFLIRSHLKSRIPKGRIIDAFIPELFGKERRKTEASKEGLLGVEGVSTEVIKTALERAGVTVEKNHNPKRMITKADLYEMGLSGRADSVKMREKLLSELNLPRKMSANLMLDALNAFLGYDELVLKIGEIFKR